MLPVTVKVKPIFTFFPRAQQDADDPTTTTVTNSSNASSSNSAAMRLKLRRVAHRLGAVAFAAVLCVTVLGNVLPGATVDRGPLPEFESSRPRSPKLLRPIERAPRSIIVDEPEPANSVLKFDNFPSDKDEFKSSEKSSYPVKSDREVLVTTPVRTEPPPPGITLDDVFISVKTTKQFHESRLDVIIKTWFTLAPKQVSAKTNSCSSYQNFDSNLT